MLILRGMLLVLFVIIYNIANIAHANETEKIYLENNSFVLINGDINEKSVKKAIKLLDDLKTVEKKLIIASSKADDYSALKLAKYVKSHKVLVYIKGVCVDACVSIILPVANKVVIEENSLLAIRYNSYSSGIWLLNNNIIASDNLSKLAKIEGNFYAAHNINIAMLNCGFEKSKPKLKYISNKRDRITYIFASSGWRLNKDEISALGIKNIEYIPASTSTLQVQDKINKLEFTTGCTAS